MSENLHAAQDREFATVNWSGLTAVRKPAQDAAMHRYHLLDSSRGLLVRGWSVGHQQPIAGGPKAAKKFETAEAAMAWVARQPGAGNFGLQHFSAVPSATPYQLQKLVDL